MSKNDEVTRNGAVTDDRPNEDDVQSGRDGSVQPETHPGSRPAGAIGPDDETIPTGDRKKLIRQEGL